jgi:excisionase family DNA binding protein
MDAYTIPDAARALGLSAKEVRGWIEDGRLSAAEVEGRWLIPAGEVRRLARRPPELRGPADAAPREELGALQQELDELRGRVEALEASVEGSQGGGMMRPALTPLFRPPRDGG